MSPSLQTSVPRSWVPRLMRKKKKQLTERKSFRDGTLARQFTYSVKVPCPLEGKSLFETHCSPSLLCQQHTDRLCVCVCANAYLSTPHPKRCKPCLYKSEREEKRGREREMEIWQGTGQREGGGGRKMSLLHSCCHGNTPDNTDSLCHSGMKDFWVK